MNRTLLNILIDIAAASLFLAMIVTGYILRFPLPPGTNKSAALWGLTRHEWGTIHSWISFALLGVIFLHLVLHWQWIVSVIGKRLHLTSKAHPGLLRSGIIVASLLGLIFGLFALAAQQSVTSITEAIPGVCPPEIFQSQAPPAKPTANGESQSTLWACSNNSYDEMFILPWSKSTAW